MTPSELDRFKDDQAYKRLSRIRSQLIRHAFDKPDGDAYSGFGYGSAKGPVLKAGSGRPEEPGYFENFRAFWKLLETHNVIVPSSPHQPFVSDKLLRRFTGVDPL
jgi:hypothetical protein